VSPYKIMSINPIKTKLDFDSNLSIEEALSIVGWYQVFHARANS